jgi:hypothetical protein
VVCLIKVLSLNPQLVTELLGKISDDEYEFRCDGKESRRTEISREGGRGVR